MNIEACRTFVLVLTSVLDINKDRTCQQHTDCFLKPWLLHEHSHAISIFTCEPDSRKPGVNECRAGEEIQSRYEEDGDPVLGSMGLSHDSLLMLESEERPTCHRTFQKFEYVNQTRKP